MDLLLLAGGDGRRIGGGKPFLDIHGTPLWRWVADHLGAAGAAVTISTGSHGFDAHPYPAVPDRIPDRGPLEGLAAAHARRPTLDWVVWTVDVPAPADGDLDALAVVDDRVRCLVDAGGVAQPLMARWPASVLAEIDAYLDAGGRSVTGFLERHPPRPVGTPVDRAHLTAPADLEAWLHGA